jgi:serine/threonine-protein kinase
LFPVPASETQPGDAMMTPLYASPEQIRGEPVTTATDVYALGVVLFELLTGQLPYAGALTGLPLRDSICNQNPRRASETVDDSGAVTPKRLAGDLDTILAMALRKEPERRYGSVEQMASDIERHLNGFPVSAQPDSIRYRASKFVVRHRTAAAAAAAAVVVLAASSVVNYRVARQAEYDRDTARVVADFMARLFHASNPVEASGKNVTARQLLERGEERIDEELKDKPEVRARLLTIIGKTQKDLGNLDRALALHQRALRVRTTLFGEDHPDIAESLHAMAQVLNVKGRYEESEQALRRALRIQQAALPPSSRATLHTMGTLGLVLNQRGLLEESVAVLEPALAELRKAGGAENGSADDLYEDTLNNYSLSLQELGRFDECEKARRALLELDRKRYGEEHINFAMDLASVGHLLMERDEVDEAEPMLRRSLALHRKLLAPGSNGVVHTMQYLAICLQKMGRLEEAEALWNELRPARIRIVGEKHRLVATDLSYFGDLLLRKGDAASAEAALRKAIEMRRGLLKPGHPAHAGGRIMLGRVLMERGELAAAESEMRLALDVYRGRHGHRNPRTTATAELQLGRVLWRLGRNGEAEQALRQSYESRRDALPEGDWQLSESMLEYGRFLTATGQGSQGEALVAKANSIRGRRQQKLAAL